jgi:tetratricopeptide (TPR) repeat protein
MSFSTGHALLIGVGSYIHHAAVTNLPNTVEDVHQLAAILTDPQYCGYPAVQVTVLHDATATRDGVLAALDHLVTTTTPDSTVLIYYAGHGHYDAPADAADRVYYLTTHETDLTPEPPTAPTTATANRWIVPDTAISQAELLAALQRLPAQRVLLLFNACHAGELHPTMSLGTVPAPVTQSSNPPEPLAAALLGTGSGRVIVTACRDSQVSQAGPGPTTIFAEYLLAALQGHDVSNRDGTISAFDLYMTVYAKVKARVLDRYYRHQEPVLTTLRGIGPFPVALYQGARSMGITDAAALPPEGDAVRLISIQQSQQALATLLGRMDQKLDRIDRRLDRLTKPAPPPPDPRVQAQTLLDTMPLDAVPGPAPFPPFSRMPYASNPHFVGRDDALLALAQALKGGGRVALGPRAAVTGLGGIGKTSVASEFVHRYGQYFAGGVFWLSFADPAAVPSEVAACGGAGLLDLRPDFGELKQDEQVALVTAAWRQEIPRLLVFDNCEDPKLVEEWAPPTGGCRVLITSRRQRWPGGLRVQTQRLAVLARASSIALLQQLTPRLTTAEAGSIAEELGDLPLALQLAGSYLSQFERTRVATYLAELTSDAVVTHPSLSGQHDEDVSLTAHDRHVGRTFLVSYQHLDPTEPTDILALQLLARAACLAPGEPIPLDLLLATVDLDTESVTGQLALQHLFNLSLLSTEIEHTVQIHRLVHAFVQTMASHPLDGIVVAEVFGTKVQTIIDAWDPLSMYPLLPHLRWLVHNIPMNNAAVIPLIHGLNYHEVSVSNLAYREGNFIGAQAILIQAYEAYRQLNDKRGMALTQIVMSEVWRARGLLKEAYTFAQQGLRTYRTLRNKRGIAHGLKALGAVVRDQGHYLQAQQYFREGVDVFTDLDDQQEIADMVYRLGGIAYRLGDAAAERAYYEQSLAIYRRIGNQRGEAYVLNNYALIAADRQEYQEAGGWYRQSLDLFRLVNDQAGIAMVRINQGSLALKQQEWVQAQTAYTDALHMKEHIGIEGVAVCLAGLAFLDASAGQLEKAARLLGAIDRCSAELGHSLDEPDHAAYRETVAYLNAQLDPSILNANQALGRAMLEDEAIAYALNDEA